jgi:hypothetical protein
MRAILNAVALIALAVVVALAAYAWLFMWTAEKQAELPSICSDLSRPIDCIARAQEAAP